MEVVVARAAALDIGKKTLTACVRTPDGAGGRRQEVRTVGTFLDDLVALREWLVAEQVAEVAMEATGSYWKPIVRHETLCYRAVWDDRRWPVAAGW